MMVIVFCKEVSYPVRPECSPLGECIEGYSLFEKSLKKISKIFQITKKEVYFIGITLRYILLHQGYEGHSGRTGKKNTFHKRCG